MAGDFLGEQMRRMAANWTNVTNGDKAAIKENFRPLLEKWGEERFKRCVDRCIEKHAMGFFPTVGDFQGYDMGPSGKSGGLCEKCKPLGFVLVKKYSQYYGRMVETNVRCTHEPVKESA